MNREVEQTFHTVGGVGEKSYVANSSIQKKVILQAKHIVEKTILEVYGSLLPECMVVADLGCGSSSNTLLVVSEVIDVIDQSCRQLARPPPEIQFFLQDLPGNDFNTVFQLLTSWERRAGDEKLDKFVPYNVVGLSGSFYGRLFPRHSIHFFHSSNSMHWLSQVPRGLVNGIPLNKGNIYISHATPASVINLYLEQFQRDFSAFLKFRSSEIIPGGRMVLTFVGRNESSHSSGGVFHMWGLLSAALTDMIHEGILKDETLDNFNVPFYAPSMKEVNAVIHDEGSYNLDQVQIFEQNWNLIDDVVEDFVSGSKRSGENIAKTVRAVMESTFTAHLGEALMDDLFSRYAEKIARHLLKVNTTHVFITISLKKIM